MIIDTPISAPASVPEPVAPSRRNWPRIWQWLGAVMLVSIFMNFYQLYSSLIKPGAILFWERRFGWLCLSVVRLRFNNK